jgi:hypothetical protein
MSRTTGPLGDGTLTPNGLADGTEEVLGGD